MILDKVLAVYLFCFWIFIVVHTCPYKKEDKIPIVWAILAMGLIACAVRLAYR